MRLPVVSAPNQENPADEAPFVDFGPRSDAAASSASATPPVDPSAAWYAPQAAYIHLPFCAHKCGYCDFASFAGREAQVDAYLDALELEMTSLLTPATPIRTLFIGGGTPTYLPAPALERVLARLRHWFQLADDYEWTVESNPNTLDATKVALLADFGVNRVSLGAQSFHPHLLERLERDHDPASVERAIGLLRPRIDNLSVDLIFGVMGQTLEEWRTDLDRLLDLGTTHLSAYGLTFEKGTKLDKQRRAGLVQPIDENIEAEMFEYTIDYLNECGWEHYEISNYARRDATMDYRCRHNLVYWANHAYWGFGVGAAGYVYGARTLNTREFNAYINRCLAGQSPRIQCERLSDRQRAGETILVNLRRRRGIDKAEFVAQTGFHLDELTGATIADFVKHGLIENSPDVMRLTRAGLLVADSILAAFL